jgi:hypothetical protein
MANGTYYRRYRSVTKQGFQVGGFYDPMDIVQVKYEMLCGAQDSGRTIGAVAEEFGFSRTAYYAIKENFEANGLAALIPEKKGPREQHKLTKSLREFVDEYIISRPKASAAEITRAVMSEKGVEISKRTIERYKAKKKPL